MRSYIRIFITFFCFVAFVTSSYPQVTSKQKRERKRMIRKCSKSKTPYILLNNSRVLSPEEFLNFSDSIYSITKFKGERTIMNHQNESIMADGALFVTTQGHKDLMNLRSRQKEIQDFRANEIRTFFGREVPLILMGNREITLKEYIELPEDTVAFVNFYMTPFVKKHYAPKACWGIVYVCPRNTRSLIQYIPELALPANGRNYLEDFYRESFPCFIDGDGYSHLLYLRKKAEEYREKLDFEFKGTIIISCVIRPNGTIDPILVEDIDTQQALTDQQEEALIKIAEKIIWAMPRWKSPGSGNVCYRNTGHMLVDSRECSISLRVQF